MKFGDILRELLEEREISQKQLAQDLNLAPSTLGNYIRNLREPDYDTLKKIAEHFHVSTDFLLDFKFQNTTGYNENRLLNLYRSMTKDQQELFIEQGKLFIRHNQKKKLKNKSTEYER